MNANNLASKTASTKALEINSQSAQILETALAGADDEIRLETRILVESILRRAQVEAKSASTVTRESYLNDFRRAKAIIGSDQTLKFNGATPDRLESSWLIITEEVERNLYLITKEVIDFGHRLQHAVQIGWETFNQRR